jgi:peptidylprolyl isomerase
VGEEDYLETPGFDFRGAPHAGVKYFDLQKGQGDALEAGKTAVLHYTCRYRGLTAVSSREARTLGGNRTIAEPLELKFGKLPGDYAKPLVRKTVVGIGAELRIDPELRELYVVNTVFGGPADRAGIKPQDAIVSIEGVGDLVNVPIAEIGALLAGDAGTDVNLEVRRKADGPGAAPAKQTLTREATAVVPKKRAMDVEGGGGLFTGEGAPKPPPGGYVPEALRGMRVGGRRNIVVPADRGYADVGEGEIPPGATFKLEVELLEVRSAA